MSRRSAVRCTQRLVWAVIIVIIVIIVIMVIIVIIVIATLRELLQNFRFMGHYSHDGSQVHRRLRSLLAKPLKTEGAAPVQTAAQCNTRST